MFQIEGPMTEKEREPAVYSLHRLAERQRELVPGRRTKDGERAIAKRIKFGTFDGEAEGVCSRQKDQ